MARSVLKGASEMEPPRLLVSFALTLVLLCAVLPAAAQQGSVNQYPDRTVGKNHSADQTRQYYITQHDCIIDDALVFDVTTTNSTNYNLQVWAGQSGTNCATDNERSGSDASCWMVYSATADNTMLVEVRARDIARRVHGSDVQGAGTIDDCYQDIVSGGISITLHFLLAREDQATEFATFPDTGLDLAGPDAVSDVSVSAGEGRASVSWSIDGLDDYNGYRIYCASATTTLGAAGSGSDNGTGGQATGNSGGTGGQATGTVSGAGGQGGQATGGTEEISAAGDSSTASESTSNPPHECDFGDANILVQGEVPPDELTECGSGTGATTVEGTANGLENGVNYQVAVAGVDILGNVGPLSEIRCATPQLVDTFYEQYKQSGGTGGGGFCALSTRRTPDILALLGGAVLALAARRRRRRSE